jgi:hypothetical protein
MTYTEGVYSDGNLRNEVKIILGSRKTYTKTFSCFNHRHHHRFSRSFSQKLPAQVQAFQKSTL